MPDIYQQTSMENILLTIFAIVVLITLGWSLYSFFRGIFYFIFSEGKQEKKNKWASSIRFMVIGVILTIGLLVSFPYILKAVNVKLTDEYSTKKVFTRAGELFKKLFEVGQIIKAGQKENEFRGQPYVNLNPSTPLGWDATQPASSSANYNL